MEELALWEKILLGGLVVLFLLWFGPGAKVALERSRKATAQDWKNLLWPVVLLIIFVILLIAMV